MATRISQWLALWALVSAMLLCPQAAGAQTDAAAGAAPDEAQLALGERLAAIDTLRGHFRQLQYASDGELLLESNGVFALLRPGYFLWDIREPERQRLLATPQYLWQYDLDLETATRRPTAQLGQLSPMQVLGGDRDTLASQFSVARNAQGDFVLVPLADSAGFAELRLRFRGSELNKMYIRDQLGQLIEIQLNGVRSDPSITPEDFSFTPPDGVDVFLND